MCVPGSEIPVHRTDVRSNSVPRAFLARLLGRLCVPGSRLAVHKGNLRFSSRPGVLELRAKPASAFFWRNRADHRIAAYVCRNRLSQLGLNPWVDAGDGICRDGASTRTSVRSKAVSEDQAVDRKAFQERSWAGAKMLFECEVRSAKIEIGNAEKEGEYSLTFSVQSEPSPGYFSKRWFW